VTAGIATIYLLYTPKIYVSETSFRSSGIAEVVKIEEVSHEDLTTLESVNTVEKNLAGRGLVERLLDDKNLALTPGRSDASTSNKPYSRNQLVDQLQDAVSPHLPAARG